MSALHQVKQNLLFYSLWTDVKEVPLKEETVLSGIPKNHLLGDDEEEGNQGGVPAPIKPEFVLPIMLGEQLTPSRLSTVFEQLHSPKRLVAGVVNDDGTVVYYIVHNGIAKPKKN
ncbi:unnamed protein product [Cyberlindnera jadinii]|uniref:tRNA-splicing endonuclease subunit Sen15 domain-containing protein n=2 Tax=Cyberlindnera jadinii (strain ATCC 18201 / CBS 1600 / BCRC 20928 / JCM 3617 / NBRC 0987 / NRRL Y-1542) TaxID=983966 RepID=A0A0H5CB45_CYBJN|nr:unnamed protein product [Cyberlindnera jadinii]